MCTSWYEKAKEFKSPLRVVAAFLLRSRETQAVENRRLRKENEELWKQIDQLTRPPQQPGEIDRLRQQVRDLQRRLNESKKRLTLPDDPPMGTHGYGARMISLAVNLARSVGLRGAERSGF